ncbi:hypothetical protein [Mycolicibacterium hodleri]|nr:hypothetical protein [Mycolicibacterium hodleri]
MKALFLATTSPVITPSTRCPSITNIDPPSATGLPGSQHFDEETQRTRQ